MLNVEEEIRAALSEYLKDPTVLGLTTDLAILARALDALPVYADVGGALLIKPSGEVLCVHTNQAWTDDVGFKVETGPEWIRRAYKACAERYPRLSNVAEMLSAGI